MNNFRFFKRNNNLLKWLTVRKYSKDVKLKSSSEIRQEFLDFFTKTNDHNFIRSSSVIPFCDPTLSFTNAGMNQFKNILTGNQKAVHKRVANSQKCIRVGGKHNDLSIVGADSYHHTFFEMLGNWSFGDYFKKEACEMAWTLLTKIYKIPPARIYVTYFKGDEKLNLPADLETSEIWKEIGVAQDRIVGFGPKENFWEMGAVGPCGVCTEIHIDHLPSYNSINRSKDVNQDLSDLTELWNLVFIEYFRNPDGSISKLPEKHVDTGMGFERLVAFLQNKSSNYDTDLFTQIFERIHKATGADKYSGSFSSYNIDTAYRILADHSRMVTVSLADGMFPEENQKLRRILRKSLLISEKDFKNENLLLEIVPEVADILGGTYPEIHKNLGLVKEIIKYEKDLYKSLRSSTSKEIQKVLEANPHLMELDVYEHSGFLKGYQEIMEQKKTSAILEGNLMFKLYDTYGLDQEFLEKLAELENMTLDREGFEKRLLEAKKSIGGIVENQETGKFLDTLKLPATKNISKFNYSWDQESDSYKTPTVKAKILTILCGDQILENTKSIHGKIQLIFDKSLFYYESGGQESDDGWIILKNGEKLELKGISSRKDLLIHEVEVKQENLQIGDEVLLEIDNLKRSNSIRNHSGVHLLNAAVRKFTGSPIYQKSSLVNSDCLKIELAILGRKLSLQDLEHLESLLRRNIKEQKLQGTVKIINSMDLLAEDDVVMVPGEVYPDSNIRLVTFGNQNSEFMSKELCCGTHAFNSSELHDFTLLNVKSTGKNSYHFIAVTGKEAEKAVEAGNKILEELQNLKNQMKNIKIEIVLEKLQKLKALLNGNEKISFLKKQKCLEVIKDINEIVKTESRSILSELLDVEMKSLIANTSKNDFIVHNLSCSDWMKSVSLQKATRYIVDRPVILFSVTDNVIKARCCVPVDQISNDFNAEKWLSEVSKVLKSQTQAPKGQNPEEVCNLKPKHISPEGAEDLIQEAVKVASNFANKFLKSRTLARKIG